MYELETRIEEIHLTAKRLAEGLLLDAVEQRFRDRDIAEAARFYHQSILRHEDAQRWREKVRPDDDPFRLDDEAAPGAFTTYDAWAASEDRAARKKG
ncbi:hypothetical protein [Rhizobium fabae]|uniref:Uncharacterized protein n=1 Tax=Rhizobium fabae TaxID=573179 RepID=A0A7W6B8H0_9HYPH|nr:hypothetical protein [Rhizobium fabae]MBB3915564.1 hypothetical protein [Rhizobium fabae]RUM11854.1 hypothetical protein EFB14_15815 [Rhizobium fabae]